MKLEKPESTPLFGKSSCFSIYLLGCTQQIAYLDSDRDAPPHAAVHIPRAATPKQHPQLHLLKLALLQTRQLTVVVHQVLPGVGVPDVTGEGVVGWGGLVEGPAVAGAHHTHPSRLRPHFCLHTQMEVSHVANV